MNYILYLILISYISALKFFFNDGTETNIVAFERHRGIPYYRPTLYKTALHDLVELIDQQFMDTERSQDANYRHLSVFMSF